jgi:hypothetical protein
MKMRRFALLLGAGLLTSLSSLHAQLAEPESVVPTEPADASSAESMDTTGDGSSESGEIGTTVDDIEQLIQLPPSARLKRESDEDPTKPDAIFSDQGTREKLLGKAPKFVYIPVGQDPMIIPWIREQIVVKEKMDDALRLLEEAKKTKTLEPAQAALDALREIQTKYPNNDKANEVAALAQTIETFLASPPDEGYGPASTKAPLPEWVRKNTTGVVLDRNTPSESIVLVGDFLLKRGDRVERFPAVVVKDILPQRVIYEYQGTEYAVPVQPY